MTTAFTFQFEPSFKRGRYDQLTRGIDARMGEREDEND